MKLVKMSLATAVLLGASAFAIDNVKVNGDAKLFYGTNNAGTSSLFEKGNEVEALTVGAGSYADTALRLGVTGDLLKGVSFGATGYAVSSLGLENNLVSNVWSGAHGVTAGNGSSYADVVGGAQVDDAAWMGELWMATTVGKTTAKAGRMELDTPLVFSEKWSVVPNTFEGAVVINQDLPDTTLVGAWIGKGNGGSNTFGVLTTATPWTVGPAYTDAQLDPLHVDYVAGAANATVGQQGGVVVPKGKFNTFGTAGAYAAGLVNNSYKPLTFQAWYYDVVSVADAYWLQADIDFSLVKGVKIGAQYAEISPKATGGVDTEAYAVKLGYEGIENLKVSVAYSDVDEANDAIYMGNLATGSAQSKLYTEAFWNRGYVGEEGSESWNAKASYDVKDVAKFCVSYTDVDNSETVNFMDMNEVAISVSRSFGALDAKLAYISTDADDQNNGSQFDSVQAYLTLNF